MLQFSVVSHFPVRLFRNVTVQFSNSHKGPEAWIYPHKTLTVAVSFKLCHSTYSSVLHVTGSAVKLAIM